MKHIITILLILLSVCAEAQTRPGYFTPVATPYEWTWGRFMRGLRPPVDTLSTAEEGSIAVIAGTVYVKRPERWAPAGSSGGAGGTEVDPVFQSSAAYTISAPMIAAWNAKLMKDDSAWLATKAWVNAQGFLKSVQAGGAHKHIAADIEDLTIAVRNMISGGTGITYTKETGVISASGTGSGAQALKPYAQSFVGTSTASFQLTKTPASVSHVQVYINGVKVPQTCQSLTVNTILINVACLGYQINTLDVVEIEYKSEN